MKQLGTAHTGGAGVGDAVTHFWSKDFAGAAGTALAFADITGTTPALQDTQRKQFQTVIVSHTRQGHPLQRTLPRIAACCICFSVYSNYRLWSGRDGACERSGDARACAEANAALRTGSMPPFMNAWAGTRPPRAHKTEARIVNEGSTTLVSFEWVN